MLAIWNCRRMGYIVTSMGCLNNIAFLQRLGIRCEFDLFARDKVIILLLVLMRKWLILLYLSRVMLFDVMVSTWALVSSEFYLWNLLLLGIWGTLYLSWEILWPCLVGHFITLWISSSTILLLDVACHILIFRALVSLRTLHVLSLNYLDSFWLFGSILVDNNFLLRNNHIRLTFINCCVTCTAVTLLRFFISATL